MKTNPRFTITSKQLIFIIIGSTIATGVLSLPRTASTNVGPDGWLAVLLGSLVPLLSLLMIVRLGRLFPDKTLIEISYLLLGKFFGFFINIGFIAHIVFFESIPLRVGTEFTSVYILPKTPTSVIALMIIIAAIYVARKGAKVIGRLNEILFYILLLDLLLLLPTLKGVDYTNILPLGEAGFLQIAQESLKTSFSYGGIEILLVIYPMVTRKDEVLKAGVVALSIITCIYVLITVVCLLVFGSEMIQHLIWPSLTLLKTVHFPVIDRLEFFFLALWLLMIPRPFINLCFAGSFSLTQVLKLDLNKYYPLMVIIVGLAIYVVALIPKNIVEVAKFATYGGYSFLIIGLGYPLLLNIAASLQKGKVN